MRRLYAVIAGFGLVGAAAAGGAAALWSRDGRMAEAASAFLGSLRPELREEASVAFDDANRRDWHFIPRDRRGAVLKDMDAGERVATHGLLRSGLSASGYLKSTEIMGLESVLYRLESVGGNDPSYRDPERFWTTVFGEPGGDEPWGWRFEGHHLSLNFTAVDGEVAVTPMFFGANPAEVRSGSEAGLRVLWNEESFARRLVASLDAEQREVAVITTRDPRGIILSPGVGDERIGEPEGLAYAQMDGTARGLVEELLGVWAGNLAPELRDAQLARVHDAGLDGIHFLWIGSDEPGRPHYYRLHGPTLVIEYDNTQNNANHIHTVWRDPARDFGDDLLAEHLSADHQQDHSHDHDH